MAGRQTEQKPRCFFCGHPLEDQGRPNALACGGCRAVFRIERDPNGCVVRMEVQDCGTPDCCRQQSSGMTAPSESARSRWYHSVWFVLLMLFLVLGPFGCPLLWRSPKFSKPAKVSLTILVVLYTLLLLKLTASVSQMALDILSSQSL